MSLLGRGPDHQTALQRILHSLSSVVLKPLVVWPLLSFSCSPQEDGQSTGCALPLCAALELGLEHVEGGKALAWAQPEWGCLST